MAKTVRPFDQPHHPFKNVNTKKANIYKVFAPENFYNGYSRKELIEAVRFYRRELYCAENFIKKIDAEKWREYSKKRSEIAKNEAMYVKTSRGIQHDIWGDERENILKTEPNLSLRELARRIKENLDLEESTETIRKRLSNPSM